MNIKQTIEHTLYSYEPNEFLPIYYDGVLDNRAEFIAYKAEQVAGPLGRMAVLTASPVTHMVGMMIEHAGKVE